MSRAFFESVDDALRSFVPARFRDYRSVKTGHNLKVWFGEPREHYEVQFVSRSIVSPRTRGGRPLLEVGFHAEHPTPDRNDQTLAALERAAKRWRKQLGESPDTGRFLGRQGSVWRRVSEVWDDNDFASPEVAIEAASRLANYIAALEPILTAASATR